MDIKIKYTIWFYLLKAITFFFPKLNSSLFSGKKAIEITLCGDKMYILM